MFEEDEKLFEIKYSHKIANLDTFLGSLDLISDLHIEYAA